MPPEPPHASRWETIRHAIDSNPRTIRLCAILLVVPVGSGLTATLIELVQHVRLRATTMPRHRLDETGGAGPGVPDHLEDILYAEDELLGGLLCDRS
ncbi:MAG TPA: hypothetical protein VGZ22_26900 [Isosphaeraceae bacterium]|nr:hypothetical protein [Isosphaeraceae bacterium]